MPLPVLSHTVYNVCGGPKDVQGDISCFGGRNDSHPREQESSC